MILVFSDLHLGRSKDKDEFLINSLCDCIGTFEVQLHEVIFLGDVFDSYMEYENRPDSNHELLLPAISLLQRRDIPVSYFVGNHDPWHLSHFQDSYGIDVQHEPVIKSIFGGKIYFSHGDEHAVIGIRSRIVRHFMRRSIYFWLYRSLIPPTIGQELPRKVSRRFSDGFERESVVECLAKGAIKLLETNEMDVVVFGHSHVPATIEHVSGTYYNTGSWYVDLSYLEIRPNTITVRKWTSSTTRHQNPGLTK